MTETEIDPYPVSELTTRFGIGRTALYDRLKALGVVPTKQGSKAFVSKEQLQRLDALDEHLKDGGAIADFERAPLLSGEYGEQNEQAYPVNPKLPSGKLSRSETGGPLAFFNLDVQAALVLVVDRLNSGMKEALLAVFPSPLSRTERGLRLSHLRELEEAYEKGWLLSTSELADLLGLAAKTVRGYGTQFEQAGFTFTRSEVGSRARGEAAWQVGKLNLPRPISPE